MLTLVLASTLSFKEIEMWPWCGRGGGHGARRCTALGLHYLETMS